MSKQQTVRIPVASDTRDKLRAAKIGGDSYDDVLNRLLELYDDMEVSLND